jgi:Zn-dependent protease with chaperone function
MDDPFRLVLTNAGAAGLIALVAWAASRVLRRPAVVHGLWLLALVRLVTPPIAQLPLLPAWTGLPVLSVRPTPTVVVIPTPRVDATSRRLRSPVEASTVGPPSVGTPHAPASAALRPASATPRPAAPGPRIGWRAAARALLASGALAIALLAAWRFVRFRRLLACARPAPPLVAERSAALAARLGLRRAPPVLLLPARIPPMLWPERGGPVLLLPERLLAELGRDELDALLAHELAHVRRRDHWVRLLEIAATAFFWWYPVTWWARRALRRAEERCCDEWVLRLLPRSAEAYANGLLKSLTFVTDRPLPAVASGLGPVDDLEARLKEILMTRPVPQLAVPLRVALAVAAALGLAVFPTRAQPSAAKDDPVTTATVAPASGAETPAPAAPPAPARKAAAPAVRARGAIATAPPATVEGVPGGVEGGVLGGVPGGVPGGVLGGTLGPTPQASSAPAPAAAAAGGSRDAARRAIEDQRRVIEEQRRQLHQQELELERKQIDLEAQAEQAELRAEAERLRAEGKPEDVARVEKRVQLNVRRVDLQKRQLQLEVEHAALEAKLEAEMRARQDRLETAEASGHEQAMEEARREVERTEATGRQADEELQKSQQAIEREMAEFEKEEQALAAEEQVRAVRDATDDLARSIAEQIESLKGALADAPAQKVHVDREIKRLQAALDALKADGTSNAQRSKTPRPDP